MNESINQSIQSINQYVAIAIVINMLIGNMTYTQKVGLFEKHTGKQLCHHCKKATVTLTEERVIWISIQQLSMDKTHGLHQNLEKLLNRLVIKQLTKNPCKVLISFQLQVVIK